VTNAVLRKFEKGDLGSAKRLIDRTIDISYAGAYPAEAIAFFKAHHSQAHILADAESQYVIVLETDGEIIGTGTLSDTTIGRVFVEPSLQGLGWGKAIMRRLEDQGRANGIRTVDLSLSLVAKPFYDALGHTTQEERSIPLENDRGLRYYAMIKRIGSP
jgi:GNAT superfamily N-acetyltransferase